MNRGGTVGDSHAPVSWNSGYTEQSEEKSSVGPHDLDTHAKVLPEHGEGTRMSSPAPIRSNTGGRGPKKKVSPLALLVSLLTSSHSFKTQLKFFIWHSFLPSLPPVFITSPPPSDVSDSHHIFDNFLT